MLSNNQAAVLLMSLNAVPLSLVAYRTAHHAPAGQAASAVNEAAHPILKMAGVLVQLQTSPAHPASRYLAIDLDLELAEESDRPVIVQRMTWLRESVLTYFSDQSAAQLERPGALLAVKSELRDRINQLLPAPRVRNIYVTQFIIQ